MKNKGLLTRKPPRYKGQALIQGGFTLLEIAIVMVVLGLLLGGAMLPLSIQMEKMDRDATHRQLTDIRDALMGFALVNGRLPCPDTDSDGLADGLPACSAVEGGLPWSDLGLGRQDAWGRPFTYRVSADFADQVDGTACLTPTLGVSFSLCSLGDISILDADGGNPVASALPAVIISHGKNWAEVAGLDELENTDGDAILVDRFYSKNSDSTFDDLVIWLPPNILMNNMVSAGLLP